MSETNLPIIGSLEKVSIGKHKNVPAKIDTGADSTSVWASDIRVTPDGVLEFSLFAPGSKYYNGKTIRRKHFTAVVVRSATGEEQIRYRTQLTFSIAGKRIKVMCSLSDRSRNHMPILIGRRTISKKFLVDVSRKSIKRPKPNEKTSVLQQLLSEDPFKFHQEYVELARKGNQL